MENYIKIVGKDDLQHWITEQICVIIQGKVSIVDVYKQTLIF